MRKDKNSNLAENLIGAVRVEPPAAAASAAPAAPKTRTIDQTANLSSECRSQLLEAACRQALMTGKQVSEGKIINAAIEALRADDTMDGDTWPFANRTDLSVKNTRLTPENYEWVRRKSVTLKAGCKQYNAISAVIEYAILSYINNPK